MQALSDRTASFTDSVIRRMTRISNQYGAVNLSQGFPDFDPPKPILDRLSQVAYEDYHQYSITWGAQDFREALAKKQSHFMGRDIDPNGEIVVTCGSTEAMMAAMITMTAQNYPRKAYERILKALGAGCMLVTAVAAVITLLCELSPEWILSLFTDEQAVIESGIRYLRFFAIGFIVENIMFCMFGTLTGAGHTMVPFCCAVISAYLVRYLLAWVFSRMTALGFDGIAIAYSIAPFISCAICSVFIASGRWKKPRIKVS